METRFNSKSKEAGYIRKQRLSTRKGAGIISKRFPFDWIREFELPSTVFDFLLAWTSFGSRFQFHSVSLCAFLGCIPHELGRPTASKQEISLN